MFLLHTLTQYWETLISPQAASSPFEYLAATCLFGLMVIAVDKLMGHGLTHTN